MKWPGRSRGEVLKEMDIVSDISVDEVPGYTHGKRMQRALANPLLQPEQTFSLSSTDDEQHHGEQRKLFYEGRRLYALGSCLLQVIPVGATITMLYLNLRHVYWADLGAPDQNMVLQAWQYAAKAHELFINTSLSAVVLHQVTYSMSVSDGVPLGFVTAGYQLADITYLISRAFWGGVTGCGSSKGLSRLLPLALLMTLALFSLHCQALLQLFASSQNLIGGVCLTLLETFHSAYF